MARIAKPKRIKKVTPTGPGACRLCPRWAGSGAVCMSGHGPKSPRLVVIADAPSKLEDTWCSVCWRIQRKTCVEKGHQVGVPLVGPAGQVLRRALKEAGYEPNHVYFTNVVRCSGGGESKPTMVQIRKCRGYILDELATLDWSRCDGVVLLGNSALRGFLNDGGLDVGFCRFKDLDVLGPTIPLEGPPEALDAFRIDDRSPTHTETRDEASDRTKRPVVAPELDRDLGDKPPSLDMVPKVRRLIPVPIRTTYHPVDALKYHTPEYASEVIDEKYFGEIVGDLQTAFLPRDPVKAVHMAVTTTDLDTAYTNPEYLAIDLEWWTGGNLRVVGLSDGQTNVTMQNPKLVLDWIGSKHCLKVSPKCPGGESNSPYSTRLHENLTQLTFRQQRWQKSFKP